MCFQPPRAPNCCAPTEREPNSMTSVYKHLAPLGRNPTESPCCTSKLNSRMSNSRFFLVKKLSYPYKAATNIRLTRGVHH